MIRMTLEGWSRSHGVRDMFKVEAYKHTKHDAKDHDLYWETGTAKVGPKSWMNVHREGEYVSRLTFSRMCTIQAKGDYHVRLHIDEHDILWMAWMVLRARSMRFVHNFYKGIVTNRFQEKTGVPLAKESVIITPPPAKTPETQAS